MIGSERINGAVRDCLDACRAAEYPIAHLAVFLRRLKAAGWEDADLRRVERTVVKILTAIVGTDRMSKEEEDTTPEIDQLN